MGKFTKSFLRHTKGMLTFLFVILGISTGFAQTASSISGWYLTGYSLKDGTNQTTSVLAGTSSTMTDKISYTGAKGDIEITHNRYDDKTGKLLAGVKYRVRWTDPPEVLNPDEKSSLDFELNTISSLVWKAPQQSLLFQQGLNGNYYITTDGTKYITKDIKARLTTEKVFDKGTKGTKRFIQMNFGNGFTATYNYEWRDGGVQEKLIVNENKNGIGWYLTGYSLKDGTNQTTSVLAGTSSTMTDKISYTGAKGDIEITHNRYDDKTGKLLAGVKYRVRWTDPPEVLNPDEKSSLDFELNTISSLVWKAPQQSLLFQQGLNGNYYITTDGTKYITKDIKARLTTEKVFDKGTKGTKRFIQMNFGNGFTATYNYEWRDF